MRGDLDWIVMKALEKERGRRYQSASAFAEDLGRHLSHEPVTAAPPSTLYRTRRFLLRNSMAAAFTAALGLSLVGGTVLSSWQAWRASRFAGEANAQRQRATNETARALRFAHESDRARNQTEARAYASQVLLASQRVEAGDLSQAERLLEACPTPLRNWEWQYLKRQCSPDCRVLETQTNEVWSVAANPDGRWLASLANHGRLLLWDLKGDLSQPTQPWPVEGRKWNSDFIPVNKALAFSHDSRSLAIARPVDHSGWVVGVLAVGSTNVPQERLRIKDGLGPLCLSFSPDDRRLMVGCSDGVMRACDVASGQEAASYEIMATAFSRDGSRVASMGATPRRWETEHEPARAIKVFDTVTGRELLAITNLSEPSTLFSLALSPDGERVAAGFVEMSKEARDDETGQYEIVRAERGWTVVWNVATQKELLRQRLTDSGPADLEFSDDGKRLAIASSSFRVLFVSAGHMATGLHTRNPEKVLVMDVMSGEETMSLRGHLRDVTAVAFLDRGRRLASASSDHTVRLWDLSASRIIPLGRGRPEHSSTDMGPSRLSADGRMIAVPISDRVCDVVDLVTGKTLASARVPETETLKSAALAYTPPGLACLSGTALHYWDLTSGQKTWSFSTTNLSPGAEGIVISPDGRRVALVSSSEGRIVQDIALLDAGSGKPIIRTNLPLWGVAFSPDSRFLLAGDFDGNVHVWDAVVGGEVLCRRATDSRPGASLRDFLVEVEDLDSPGNEILRETMGIPLTGLAVSPDGSQFATAAGFLTAELRLWDMASGQPKWARPIAAMSAAIAFSPDGRRLAVACSELLGAPTDLVIFDAFSGQELVHLPSRARINSLAFSSDGARLWGVTAKNVLEFWEASPWPGPVTVPAVALRPTVVNNPELARPGGP